MIDLHLPRNYRTNPAISPDAEGSPYWSDHRAARTTLFQQPVYRKARRLARRLRPEVIADVGCGAGHKLVHFLGGSASRVLGIDQDSGIQIARREHPHCEWITGDFESEYFWARLEPLTADLVLCVDVIEHLVDPVPLLRGLRRLAGDSGLVVLSTPDRDRLEGASALGPPRNPRHVREWAPSEATKLATDLGFQVETLLHLFPRAYKMSAAEFRRTVWRALHLKAIPDRRNCMVLLLRPIRHDSKKM